jgi:hypothetical protein
MMAKLVELKEEMRRRMHGPISEQGEWLKQVVGGFFNYPRRADQQPGTRGLPIPRHGFMGTHASAAQPERPYDVGPDRPVS